MTGLPSVCWIMCLTDLARTWWIDLLKKFSNINREKQTRDVSHVRLRLGLMFVCVCGSGFAYKCRSWNRLHCGDQQTIGERLEKDEKYRLDRAWEDIWSSCFLCYLFICSRFPVPRCLLALLSLFHYFMNLFSLLCSQSLRIHEDKTNRSQTICGSQVDMLR